MARVLVAEDTPEMREALELTLSDAGHEVTLCETGDLALEVLEHASFDILVLDIWMPGRGGLEVLKIVADRWPDLRPIVISGGGPDATLESVTAVADLYGAISVLFKPFDDEELIGAIDVALQQHG